MKTKTEKELDSRSSSVKLDDVPKGTKIAKTTAVARRVKQNKKKFVKKGDDLRLVLLNNEESSETPNHSQIRDREDDLGSNDMEVINWLLTEIDKMVEIHKDRLLFKAKKPGYPTFIWISPPQHKTFQDNDIRVKIDKVLRNSLNGRKDHTMMCMKKYWDFNDLSLFNGNSYSNNGWETFWLSIDSAIQSWDRHLAPKSLGFTHLENPKQSEDPMKSFISRNASSNYQGKGLSKSTFISHQGGTHKGNKNTNRYFWWKQKNNQQNQDLRMKLPKPPRNNTDSN